MAKLATCPGCTTQLALPEKATLSDRARCPRCQEEFMLMEAVQFSIPEAEIMPLETPAESFVSAESDDEYTAASFTRETTSNEVESIEGAGAEGLFESAGASTQKKLSDWEERLKRAIAADVDDEPLETAADIPGFEFPGLTSKEPKFAAESLAEANDFAVADADLVPQEDCSAPRSLEAWSPEEYSHDDDPVIHSYSEQYAEEPEPTTPVAEFHIQTDSAPRNMRQRSNMRTLASASLGVIGIPLGLYALLWLRGPAGDVLHVAQYVPSFLLPAAFAEPDFDETREQLAAQPPMSPARDALTELLAENESVSEAIEAEPLLRNDPAVAPASAAEPIYRGPTFTPVHADEFNELLAAAEPVAARLATGDLKSKESVALKGQAYMALARLADKSSYLNWPGHTPDETTKTQLAKQLFETTLRDEVVQRDLPQIALRWWQYAQRPSQGMVLTGRINRLQTTPAGSIAFVSLSTEPSVPEIPVLVGTANYQEGELVGLVGSIMANPQEQLPTLDMTADQIVIAHYWFTLAESPESQNTTAVGSELLQLTQ